MTNLDYDRIAIEIYMLFKNRSGSFSGVSGHLKENDSSRLSRQLNPTDERRDNPIIETLKILFGARKFAPELEDEIWLIIERERNRHCENPQTIKAQLAELLHKIHSELGDVVYKNNIGAPLPELEREGFELFQAVKNYCEKLKQTRGDGSV